MVGSTKSKENLLSHYCNNTSEHPNRHIPFSIRFGKNNSCVFSIKTFKLHGSQFILTEIVNLSYREILNTHTNRYYNVNKCELIAGNYAVLRINP